MTDFITIENTLKYFENEGIDCNNPNKKLIHIAVDEINTDNLTYIVKQINDSQLNNEYIKYLLSYGNVYDKIKNDENKLNKFHEMEGKFMDNLINIGDYDELLVTIKNEIVKIDNYKC